jgi:hypothetical protein
MVNIFTVLISKYIIEFMYYKYLNIVSQNTFIDNEKKTNNNNN